MTTRYILWNRVKINDNKYIDPNSDNLYSNSTNWGTFHETPYLLDNWKFVSWIEYPSETTQERIDELVEAFSWFNFEFVTEAEANDLLSELWDVTVSDFVFEDLRPVPEF